MVASPVSCRSQQLAACAVGCPSEKDSGSKVIALREVTEVLFTFNFSVVLFLSVIEIKVIDAFRQILGKASLKLNTFSGYFFHYAQGTRPGRWVPTVFEITCRFGQFSGNNATAS